MRGSSSLRVSLVVRPAAPCGNMMSCALNRVHVRDRQGSRKVEVEAGEQCLFLVECAFRKIHAGWKGLEAERCRKRPPSLVQPDVV
jgi:hypothetical protein